MSVISLILAILAFLLSFIDGSVILVLLLGFLSILFSAIGYYKKEGKVTLDIAVICAVVVFASIFNSQLDHTVKEDSKSSEITYFEKDKDKDLYNLDEKIEFYHGNIILSNPSRNGKEVIVDVEVNASPEYLSKINSFYFYIIDCDKDEVYYPDLNNSKKYFISEFIEKGEKFNGQMRFKLDDVAENKTLYLVYKDMFYGFKIKL